MNVIDNAIKTVNYSIPNPILEYAFIDNDPYRQYVSMSRDALIRHEVIDNRVMVDCNLVGGEQVVVPIDPIPVQIIDGGRALYRIDKKYLQGRRILNVLGVSTGDHRLDTYSNSYCSTSVITDSISTLLDAATGNDSGSSNRVRLIGENTILLEDRLTYNQLYLRCFLSNDNNFSNFSPRSTIHFTKLVVLAVKSYVYNSCVLEVDAGQLHGGMTIGRFREIIDQYSDAEAEYLEYLTGTFASVSFQQDGEAHRRHLKIISSGLR